ncbi:MAG: DMT family transporter [Chloroflexi bacterium]|nr:DMT family transporter [Chloroflexota bacterium]
MTPKALLALLALGAIWGASFLFIKVIVDETSPLEVTEGRMFFGALAVGVVIAMRKMPLRRPPALWFKVAVWALVGIVVPFILIAWAEEHIDSGTASVLNSSMPLFTVLFAAIFLIEEQLTPARVAGLGIGFVGVIVLTGGDVYDLRDSAVLSQLAVVGAAACYGAGAVYARSLLKEDDPVGLTGGQLVLGTLLVLPIMLVVRGTPDYSLSVEAWLSLLALGVLGTGIAIIIYLWLVDNVGSVRSSLVTYIIPVVGLFLGWAVLDESIGVNTVLGCALIIAGVAAVMRGQAPSSQRLPVAADATAAD